MRGLAWNDRVHSISSLFSLLIHCPYGIDMNTACPFNKFRQLDELQKTYLAENISDKQRQKLISEHYDCCYCSGA